MQQQHSDELEMAEYESLPEASAVQRLSSETPSPHDSLSLQRGMRLEALPLEISSLRRPYVKKPVRKRTIDPG